MLQPACIIILVHVYLVVVYGHKECSTLHNGDGTPCDDLHAECMIDTSMSDHNGTCQCLDGYRHSDGKCITNGTPLPRPDYDSDWILATSCNTPPYCDFQHGLGETPAIVDVQINDHGVVYHAIGFRPDEKLEGFNVPNFVVYIYDEVHVNVSTTIQFGGEQYVPRTPHYYTGYTSSHGIFYSWIRARAWKLTSLPEPDFRIAKKTMRANTSRAEDSFYEVEHKLDDYPGLVVVRARMVHDNTTFYANGVGSALKVFYNDSTMTNAYLVYGFNDKSFRVWVDSSSNGAIFDGRKFTRFNWIVSEAVVEIYAWKLSTLPPYHTKRLSLDLDKFESDVKFPINFRISDTLTMAFAEIKNHTAINNGYRFPASSYIADSVWTRNKHDCLLGGVRFGYRKIPPELLIFTVRTRLNRWWINIPKHINRSNATGLLCIPQTFGGGTKAERTNGGTLVVYNWIDDCDVPSTQHAIFDISVNGTEIGAYVQKTCNVGYVSDRPLARCSADLIWYGTECYKINCDEFRPLVNGTSVSNSTSYGARVTFECNEGFKLIGDKHITCLADRTWSGNSTLCVELPEEIEESTTMVTKIDEHMYHDDDDEAKYNTILTAALITTVAVVVVLLIVVILTRRKC